ncbi:hypothetical protein H7097_02165 [Aeromicrobium sp.]|nr:hypothetical protein [Candidatus Saccharibacteria bacterium]
MSFEDRPRSTEHDAHALLFTRAAALLSNIGPSGYSGTIELPISPKAAIALESNETLQLKQIVSCRVAAEPLSLEIGDTGLGELGIVSVSVPLRSQASKQLAALIFERGPADEEEVRDMFLTWSMPKDGPAEMITRTPFVSQDYLYTLLETAKHPLTAFPDDPSGLRLMMAGLLSKADTYTMHREKEFAIDPVHSLRVASTVNRFYEAGNRGDQTSRIVTPRSRKRRSGGSESNGEASGYRHSEVLEVIITEFDEGHTARRQNTRTNNSHVPSIPARPIATQTLRFEGADHNITSVEMRTQYELDPDNTVSFRDTHIDPPLAERIAKSIAAYNDD